MNKKGVSVMGFVLSILGAILAMYMAGKMQAGFGLKLIAGIATFVVCYFITSALGSGE